MSAQLAQPLKSTLRIDYDNDTGPGDEGLLEWWSVVDESTGETLCKCDDEATAKRILAALAAFEAAPQQEPVASIDDVAANVRVCFGEGAAAFNEGVDALAAEYKRCAAPQQKPAGYVTAIEEGKVLMLPRSSLNTDSLVPVYAAPQQAQAPGWQEVPMCSENAVLHALDMARTESRKQGDQALFLAFGRAMWRQFNAMAAPQQGSNT